MDTLTSIKVLLALTAAAAVTMWCFLKKKQRPVTLNKTEKVQLTLVEKQNVSHDTRLFRFALPSPDHILGLPVGSFVNISATLDNKLVVRPYTPISSDDEPGFMDLMIKVYEGGKMSSYLDSLSVGDRISVRGPCGKIQYLGNGLLQEEKSKEISVKLTAKHIGMIAGGSGITPMLQLIREIIKRDDDHTQISLLFSNKTDKDILCQEMLDTMCCPKLSVCHTLTQQKDLPPEYKHEVGRVDRTMVEKHLPPPGPDSLILLCGPPGLVKQCCVPLLKEMGYLDINVMVF